MNTLTWLLHLVTRNFGWKILSLFVAVLLWVVVSSEPELSTFANVPLEYKNLPPDLEVSSSLIESVYLEVRGPAGELRSMNDVRRPAVVLDMTGVRPGERTFVIGYANVRMPRGVRLVRAVPAQVRFDFETRAFRTVPVRVRFANERQADDVASYLVTPPQLLVLGPESHVSRITNAVTDPIDVTGVSDNAQIRASAFVEDAYVRFQSPPSVVVSVKMKEK